MLAGGASRRMGTDKAVAEVDGEPMALLVGRALLAAGASHVVQVGGDPALAASVGWGAVADRWPGEGPLAGIATAVAAAAEGSIDAQIVVVAACDQPDLAPVQLAGLAESLVATPGAVAAAFVDPNGRRHPLPVAWRCSAAPALATLVARGARRADASFGVGPVVSVAADAAMLSDVDTPEDLAARRRGASRT